MPPSPPYTGETPATCWTSVLPADVFNPKKKKKNWTPCRDVTNNSGFLRKPTDSVRRMWPLLGLKSLVSSISAGVKKPDPNPAVSLRPLSERQE